MPFTEKAASFDPVNVNNLLKWFAFFSRYGNFHQKLKTKCGFRLKIENESFILIAGFFNDTIYLKTKLDSKLSLPLYDIIYQYHFFESMFGSKFKPNYTFVIFELQ